MRKLSIHVLVTGGVECERVLSASLLQSTKNMFTFTPGYVELHKTLIMKMLSKIWNAF